MMITYMLMNLAKFVFWAVLDVLRALAPQFWADMSSSIVAIAALPSVGVGVYIVQLLVPISYLMGAYTTCLLIILTAKILHATLSKTGMPWGSGTQGS